VSASRIAPPPAQASPTREAGGQFLRRAEVRDVLAWMRLLIDPQDAAAVVRALARPPIELRQVELARVIQVARRRKLDLVLGLTAATESPQVPPEARERIRRFVELHGSAAVELDTVEPDVFVARLIERLGAPGRDLLAPEDAAEQQASLQRLRALAAEFVRSRPRSSTRDLARHLATFVPERPPSRVDGDAPRVEADASRVEADAPRADADASRTPLDAAQLDASGSPERDRLQDTLRLLREEVLDGVARIGGRLGELRLDTDLDISHGVVRYLELLKLSALLQRPEGQDLGDALGDVNARILGAATPLQREILQTSTLDGTLLAALRDEPCDGGDERALAQAVAPREARSLGPFLPRRGNGVALSASDIQTYRSCPLRYKFARVLRIPTEQTIHQRFGIVVHQVLERFHSERDATHERMQELLDAGWRRAGLHEHEHERELLDKARTALARYHARLAEQRSQPVWFERQFDFRVGPHHLRGRVDRVDRVVSGGRENGGGEDGREGEAVGSVGRPEYELIDYKTSRPKTAEQLRDDLQLSLYALAAREDWQLASSRQAYYYVLDDLKVPVADGERDAAAVESVVLEVGEGILAQEFEPTPSHSVCAMCDYRIVCPAAEA
jgi:CRISPR/Cas system-associated exonuclease Cas4 (RecB family)